MEGYARQEKLNYRSEEQNERRDGGIGVRDTSREKWATYGRNGAYGTRRKNSKKTQMKRENKKKNGRTESRGEGKSLLTLILRNGWGGSKLVVLSYESKLRLKPRSESSRRMTITSTRKKIPMSYGTSSQSLKKRITRHLTARSRSTGSLTSSENGRTTVRRQIMMD